MGNGVDIAQLQVVVPVWSVVSLMAFVVTIAWHAFRVTQAVRNNIKQNNKNVATQNAYLRQIVCLAQLQLSATSNPDFRYEGKCEKQLIEELARIERESSE